MGLFDPSCADCGKSDKTVAMLHGGGRFLCASCTIKADGLDRQQRAALSEVIISTGDIRRNYEIVEVIMTLQAAPKWDVAWARVLQALRTDAIKLGCHAISNLRVEHRVFVATNQTFLGIQQIQGIEFFACGTAVRFV